MIFIKDEKAIQKIHDYQTQLEINLSAIKQDFFLFGGAVRDALSGEETCKDFDLVFVEEPEGLFTHLTINSNSKPDSYSSEDVRLCSRSYRNLKGKTILDVLWPDKRIKDSNIIELLEMINHVDLSCCGVAYNPNCGIIEVIPEAVEHIKRKIFKVIDLSSRYFVNNTEHRIQKLIQKGWFKV